MNGKTGFIISALLLLTVVPMAAVLDAGAEDAFLEVSSENEYLNEQHNFIKNKGQWDSNIGYLAETSFGHVSFSNGKVSYDVVEIDGSSTNKDKNEMYTKMEGSVIHVKMIGGEETSPSGIGELKSTYNFFLGSDRTKWETKVPSYGKIVYEDVWEGIDMEYYRGEEGFKYDLILSPGSGTSNIAFELEGHSDLYLDGGEMVVVTPTGSMLRDGGLRAWYNDERGGDVRVNFRIIGKDAFTFELHDRDPSRPVRIDPIVYSTFVGGLHDEFVYSAARDSEENVYVAGKTNSLNFPATAGAYQRMFNNISDGYFYKMDKDGGDMIYATYFGGDQWEFIRNILLDDSGNIYIAGDTASGDIPTTPNAYSTSLNGDDDIMAAKFDPTGTSLLYSTYVGGSGTDYFIYGETAALDSSDRLVFGGKTTSSDYPVTPDAFDDTFSGMMRTRDKGFLTILSTDGSSLHYSTFVGGSTSNHVTSLTVDEDDEIFVTGFTRSMDFPTTTNAYLREMPGWLGAGFVMRIDLSLDPAIVYSTYLGGPDATDMMNIEVDDEKHAFVSGRTRDAQYPVTEGVYDDTYKGGFDMFVTKLHADGSNLSYSTYIGSGRDDIVRSMKVLDDGSVCVLGETSSKEFPHDMNYTTDVQDPKQEGVVLVLDEYGGNITYSTMFGGEKIDVPKDLCIADNGDAIIAGETYSVYFPISEEPFQEDHQGKQDSFVLRMNITLPPGVPRNLEVSQGDGVLELDWDEPLTTGGLPISGYIIYRGNLRSTIGEYMTIGDRQSFRDDGVIVGEEYHYIVSAFNDAGVGAPSIIVSTEAVSRPEAPINLMVEDGDGYSYLTWGRPYSSGNLMIDEYKLYRKDLETEEVEEYSFEPNVYCYNDTEVGNGHEYEYWMTSVNDIGESGPSNRVGSSPMGLPSKPRNFTVEVEFGRVKMSWEPPLKDGGVGISNYQILKELDGGTLLVMEAGSVFNATDSNVNVGYSYTYSIRSVNALGTSEPSESVTVYVSNVPASPQNLRVSSDDGYSMVEWSAPFSDGGLDIETYRIYRSTDSEDYEMIKEIPAHTYMHLDTGLQNGIEYLYKVSAINAVGESTSAGPVTGTPAGLPKPPRMVTVTETDGSLTVTWQPPENTNGAPIISYQVLREKEESGHSIIAELSADIKEYIDSDIDVAEEYTYRVKAVNRIGHSRMSDEASGTVRDIPSPPSHISVEQTPDGLVVSWTEPSFDGGLDISSYSILRWDDLSSEWEEIDSMDAGETSYTDQVAIYGVEYRYTVVASNLKGGSERPDWVEITPKSVPSIPQSVSAMENEDGSVLISWKAPSTNGGSDMIYYKVLRSTEDGFKEIGTTLAASRSYVDHGVEEGREYTYRVIAVNYIGESEHSSDASVTTSERVVEEGSTLEGISPGIYLGAIGMLLLIAALLVAALIRKGKKSNKPVPSPVEETVQQSAYDQRYQGYDQQGYYQQGYDQQGYYQRDQYSGVEDQTYYDPNGGQ